MAGTLSETNAVSGILDLAHLARCTQGDRALESEILTLYMEQAREQIRLVHEAREKEALRRAVHTLKGAALAVGVRSVAGTAERLEELDLEAACEARTALLVTLASDVAAAEKCIRGYLKQAFLPLP